MNIDTITEKALKGGIETVIDGLKVEAIGCAMLAKIKSGKRYRLKYFYQKPYGHCVTFYPLRGKNPVVSHEAWSVLSSIQNRENGFLNGLQLIA